MSVTPRKPSRFRLSLWILLMVYPLVTAVSYILMGVTQEWAIWQRNLIMVPIIVISMVYMIIPFIHKRCARWL